MSLNMTKPADQHPTWINVCALADLVPHAGVPALVAGRQVALFYLPEQEPAVYALDNWCPAAQANVLARGIVGDLNGELVVASPLYKEHFRLASGLCVEKPLSVRRWPVLVTEGRVKVQLVAA